MIRRALLIGAAVALPVTGMSAIALGAGAAGAAKPPPVAETCATSGSVTFVKPGLSYGGALTTKTSTLSKSAFAPNVGDATSCGTKIIKIKVTAATTACPETGGVPNAGDPGACQQSKTTKHGTTYEIAKKPNYYDTTADFASGSTTADIYAALAPGLKAKDNGDSIVLEQPPSSSDVTAVVGGACGSNHFGFQVTNGPVSDPTNSVHSWSSLTCITTDTGTGVSGDFYTDLLASGGGNNSIVIASAAFGGNSALTIS